MKKTKMHSAVKENLYEVEGGRYAKQCHRKDSVSLGNNH